MMQQQIESSIYRCWIRGASQIVQITADNSIVEVVGRQMSTVVVMSSDGRNDIGVLIDHCGMIAAIGNDRELNEMIVDTGGVDRCIDANGKVLMPGFVDAHSHPVFAGDRVHEFAMKLAGATYMQIHNIGGGINFTVKNTREATEEQLLVEFERVAQQMLRSGTTTLEAKSGYGLDTINEMKMLRVLTNAKRRLPIELSITYCGAHAIPIGSTIEQQMRSIIDEQIPMIVDANRVRELDVENIDVFCEKGVFDIESSRQILIAGRDAGLRINFHADELNAEFGGAELAAELNASAVSHLEEISDRGIVELARTRTKAIILPTTAYMLRLRSPPVRRMIESNVIIALGSDFNPNAYCMSMPIVMHLACVLCRMSLDEALIAATINSAAAIGRGHTHGALHVGRVGDVLIVDAPRWEHIVYRLGCETIDTVIKHGRVVYERRDR